MLQSTGIFNEINYTFKKTKKTFTDIHTIKNLVSVLFQHSDDKNESIISNQNSTSEPPLHGCTYLNKAATSHRKVTAVPSNI